MDPIRRRLVRLAPWRAVEELVYQLIPSLDDIAGRDVIRHGTPDTGLEAVVNFEDGTVWGWQAKISLRVRLRRAFPAQRVL